jgi:hypothetical protein
MSVLKRALQFIQESLEREITISPRGYVEGEGKAMRISRKASLPPRKRLVYGTVLAILALSMVFVLILAEILTGNHEVTCETTPVSGVLGSAFLLILGWLGGTYFGRSG